MFYDATGRPWFRLDEQRRDVDFLAISTSFKDAVVPRFLVHVLPKRFVRIRYFGFLASRTRTRELALCRQALAVAPPTPAEPLATAAPRASWPCPRCGAPMRLVERLTARQVFLAALLADILHDTS